jgi:hypothetical protein
MRLMSFTFWAVRGDFFGNIHDLSLFGFAIEKTFALLYFFRCFRGSLARGKNYDPLFYRLSFFWVDSYRCV